MRASSNLIVQILPDASPLGRPRFEGNLCDPRAATERTNGHRVHSSAPRHIDPSR